MIGADDEQTRVFALRAGIGLQRNAAKPVISAEHLFKLKKHLVAARLLQRRERMNLPELRPRHRKHFRRRVQLHRAGAERNHRMRERKILAIRAASCSEASRFRSGAVEDRMREERDVRASSSSQCRNLAPALRVDAG